jgi:hypothetical protein
MASSERLQEKPTLVSTPANAPADYFEFRDFQVNQLGEQLRLEKSEK